MLLRSLVAVACATCFAWPAVAATVQQTRPPPFQFADAGTIALTPAKLEKGVRIEVLSNSAQPRLLDVELHGLALRAPGGGGVPTQDAIQAPERIRVPPSRSIAFRLRTGSGATVAPGTYDGWLALTDRESDTVGRRKVTFSTPAKKELKPAVSEISIHGTGYLPGLTRFDPETVPLRSPGPDAKLAELDLEDGAVLGFVGKQGGDAAVVWAGGLTELADGGAAGANIRFEDVPGPGEYSGTIDFRPDEDGGEVKVTLTFTHFIIWPLLVLALGIAAAFLFKRWRNVGSEVKSLRGALAAVLAEYQKAERRFRWQARGKSYHQMSIDADVMARAAELEAHIGELKRNRLSLELDEGKYDDVVKELGELDAAVAAWGTFPRELAALRRLRRAVAAAGRAADPFLNAPERGGPALPRSLDRLLDGGAMTVDDFNERRASVEEHAELARSWIELIEALLRYKQALTEREPGVREKGVAVDVRRLDEAQSTVGAAAEELWTVEGPEQLASEQTEADVAKVQHLTSLLADYRPRPVPPPAMLMVEAEAAGTAASQDRDSLAAALAALRGLAPAGRAIDFAKLAAAYRGERRRGDLAALAFAAVVSLFAGLTALYLGKAWGTVTDYVAAFLWGFTAETVLGTLFAMLTPASDPLDAARRARAKPAPEPAQEEPAG